MVKTVNKWRMRCETENSYVYHWSDSIPTTCPHGSDHIVDPTRTVGVSKIAENVVEVRNLPLSPFDRVLTSEETVLLSLKPGLGLSVLRDVVQVENGGSVSNVIDTPEFVMSVTGANSKACLRSVERCRYVPGVGAEVCIGGHLPKVFTVGQSIKFGLFDDINGFFFAIFDTGLAAVIRKDGIDTITHRSDFSMDRMDGNGPSGLFINPLKGYIWVIRLCCFGYGAIEFSILTENDSQQQTSIILHRHYTQTRPAVSVFNLPINVELDAGPEEEAIPVPVEEETAPAETAPAETAPAETAPAETAPTETAPTEAAPIPNTAIAYVTGRKFTVLGKFEPMTRQGGQCRIGDQLGTGWVPVMSIRKKAHYLSASVSLKHVTIQRASGASMFRIVNGATLSGPAVWAVPEYYDPAETVIEQDMLSTSATGGTTILVGLMTDQVAVEFRLTGSDAVTVLVKDAVDLDELTMSMRWQEEW